MFEVRPPDAPSLGDLQTDEAYGTRVASIALQFVRGKAAAAQ